MGTQEVRKKSETDELHEFLKHLISDLGAFEKMLNEGLFEEGIRRIGAEQELFLVDQDWRPTPLSLEIMKQVEDDHFTPELALFNLEFNMDPLEFGGDCLSRMESQINQLLVQARKARKNVVARSSWWASCQPYTNRIWDWIT